MGKWIVAKYIRLSQADRDLSRNERKQESDSISHQRDMLETYIARHSDLAECEQMEFLDDGFSGTAFDRPGFEKLLEKVRRQEVTCIIVKDFSRFGRDYIELGDYLERIFPLLGVRFISVNDQYDSLDYKGTTGGLDVVMKNIVYFYYSKDLSVKVKTAKMAKIKRGEHVSGHPPYGYSVDPDNQNKFIVDPAAAKVIRRIFENFLSGMRMFEIADMLNQEGVESPAAYFRKKNPGDGTYSNQSEIRVWDPNSIKRILTRKTYYGAYVGHMVEVTEVGGKYGRLVPEEEQIVIEGMHEPIISKEEFLEARSKLIKTGRVVTGKLSYPLRGKVRCGTCRRVCRRMLKNPTKDPHQAYLCKYSRRQFGEYKCTLDDIDEKELEGIVWEAIRKMISLSDAAQKRIMEGLKKSERDQAVLEKLLDKAKKVKSKVETERLDLTEQFLLDKMTREEYQREKEQMDFRISQEEEKIVEIEKRLDDLKTGLNKDAERDMERIREYVGAEELTEELVGALVDKVLFYDKEHIEICWRFSDEFLELVGWK